MISLITERRRSPSVRIPPNRIVLALAFCSCLSQELCSFVEGLPGAAGGLGFAMVSWPCLARCLAVLCLLLVPAGGSTTTNHVDI
eukprot:scaffold48510_cov40-Cyclotella_meneghiniana.AAC.1